MTSQKSVEAGKVESNDKRGPESPYQSGGNDMHKSKREMLPAERLKLLQEKLYCKAKQERDNRKSQRRSSLYGNQAFGLLVTKHGLINPTEYFVKSSL